MADFYIKYGSKGAKLLGIYRLGNIAIRLHEVSSRKFVISKDRKILYEYYYLDRAISSFKLEVNSETDELFKS